MVQCRVKKNASIIPASTLDSDRFVKTADLLERFVDDGYVVLAQQSSMKTIIRPDDIFDTTNRELGKILLLLDVIKNDGCGGDEQQASCPTKADINGTMRRLDRLRGGIGEVANVNLLTRLIEDSKSVSRNEYSRVTRPSL